VTTRIEYYLQLCTELHTHCAVVLPQHPAHSEESNAELLAMLAQLKEEFATNEAYVALGQRIITHIIGHYPDITPQVHRDLLWFFGGDCMHYLGDDEMERYQKVEEQYYEQCSSKPDTCYRNLRAQVFGMH